MAVKVQFEIGHHSKLRSKKSPEGFTHDWELYVQGVNKADISTFVEKVVFNLHDTFPKPKRVLKEPPYAIQESGYAGFTLPIDIYFRNRDEPKRVRFEYDLDLQNSGPPQHRSEVKNFIFECPAEELRAKLLKGGGVPVAGVMSGGINDTPNLMTSSNLTNDDGGGMVSKPKLSGGNDKKHKSRPDDAKLNTFANLFGPPITKTTKPSPDNKTLNASSLITNNTIVANSSLSKDKSSKDKSGSGSSEKTKDKSDKKDKHKQISPHKDKEKKSISSEKRSNESKKDKTRDKEHGTNRDKSNSSNSRDSSIQKRAQSHTSDLSVASPKKITPQSPRALVMGTNDIKILGASGGGNIKNVDITTEIKTKESLKPKDQSSSSGKKSKKDKKDKDKDRERDKEKQRSSGETKSKDGLANTVNNTPLATTGANESKKNSMPAAHISSTSNISKKADKEAKMQAPKVQEKPNAERVPTSVSQNNVVVDKNEKKSTSSKDVNTEKDKKSHKHKKKDKSKDKDKERERDKDKNKERERDKDKQDEKRAVPTEPTITVALSNTMPTINLLNEVTKTDMPVAATPVVQTPKPFNVTTTAPTPSLTANAVSMMNSISPTKKSQNKEKKSKDKSSKDELKRQRDAAAAELTTNSKKKSKTNINKSNLHDLELSDMDSVQSTTDILTINNSNNIITAQSTTNTIRTIIEPSDSSNSSFPDLPPKPRNNLQLQQQKTISASPTPIPTPITKDLGKSKTTNTQSNITNNSAKEIKQRSDKSSKSSEKLEKHEKVNKPEKDNKKRKRSNIQQQQQKQQQHQNAQILSTNTFIEPAVKLSKKDQSKTAREKSKSPALRASATLTTATASNAINNNSSTGTSSSGNSTPTTASVNTFLPPPSTAAVTVNNNNHLTSPANNNNNISNNNNINNATNELITATTTTPTINNTSTLATNATLIAPTTAAATTWPTEYLNELQLLHNKIMTLQDNEELQQVVEMIAATGCYEITTKTFDFDLCKLDRNTVQRLQEFVASCVS